MIPQPPCKDCKDRYLGCHDRCTSYQEYKDKQRKFKTQISVNKEINAYQKRMTDKSRIERSKKKNWRVRIDNGK